MPDGTSVIWTDRDDGLEYIWLQGKPAVKLDEAVVNNIHSPLPLPPFSRRRAWLAAGAWTAGGVGLLITVIAYASRWSKRESLNQV